VTNLRKLAAAALLVTASAAAPVEAVTFTDVTAAAGVYHQHGLVAGGAAGEPERMSSGVAAGDYDRDGWIDLYVVRGDVGPNLLFRNRGDGTFEEVGEAAGVRLPLGIGAGPTFADVDGDGWLDLLVLGMTGTPPALFHNRGDGTFANVTATSGLDLPGQSFSAAFGDYDRDGDLDLAISRWGNTGLPAEAPGSLWRNDGTGVFADVSQAAGLPLFYSRTDPVLVVLEISLSFTPNFVDVDHDGWLDLLVAGDFGGSRVLRNQGDGTFADQTTAVISDENGMGAAIGDIDNDGDLDWFVSSIWDPNGVVEGHWGISGNRLYENDGAGGFVDATDAAGVRVGYWGWGSTLFDLDNDGDLDLFHTNGWNNGEESAEFYTDPSRCFVNDGTGVFTEHAADLGIVDTGQGRGVVAFDYDRDGDLDLFITNNQEPARLLRNDGGNQQHFLVVTLLGQGLDSAGVGARITVTTGATQQLRELRAGSNFESQDPTEAHFGLGAATAVDELRVEWPNGTTTVATGVAADHWLRLIAPPANGASCDGPAPANACTPARGAAKVGCALEWYGTPTPARSKKGIPGLVVSCREGDPSCDADPDLTNRSCAIRAQLCVGNQDPRFPKCTAPAIASFAIGLPKPSKPKDAADTANLGALATELDRLGTVNAPAAGKFASIGRSRCVEPASFTVPLKVSKKGKQSAGKRKLQVIAETMVGKKIKATLQLECRPAG
jgi:hypothetical protein